ncbi:mitochondrial calcium uniporter regulator 1-like [Zophobas morio]|uniref:mitochondrial calcium uniporter regulator 1-like n=1 Tax=Zophobas morio TaxID=2755281 RepID=UPI00308290CF
MRLHQWRFITSYINIICHFSNAPKFDTYEVVKKLQKAGFNNEQASVLCDTLKDTTDSSFSRIDEIKISREDHNQFAAAIDLKFSNLKNEIEILDKSKFTLVKYEQQKIHADLEKLRLSLNDEIAKLQAHLRLDFSLEKGRIRELHAQQSQAIQDARNHVDTETERLKTLIEQGKLDFLKYFFGAMISGISLGFAYMRLSK